MIEGRTADEALVAGWHVAAFDPAHTHSEHPWCLAVQLHASTMHASMVHYAVRQVCYGMERTVRV